MVALDPIRQGGGITPEDVAEMEQEDSPWCRMAARLLRSQLSRWEKFTGQAHPASPPDLAAMGVAIDPSLAQSESLHVVVETGGSHTRGMTVVDQRPYRGVFRSAPDPNINTVLSIDNARFRRLVVETLIAS